MFILMEWEWTKIIVLFIMHFFLPFSSIFLESRVHIEVVYIVYMQR